MAHFKKLAIIAAALALVVVAAGCASSSSSQQQSSASASSLPYAKAAAEYEANDFVIEAEAAFESCLDIDPGKLSDTQAKHARVVSAKQQLETLISPEGVGQAHIHLLKAMESMCDYADIELAVAQGKYQEYQVSQDAMAALKEANDEHTQYFNEMMKLKYGQ